MLVKIDIDALDEIADRLAWALDKQGKREAIVHTFDHLARTVPLPLLDERMAYLKCIWLIHRLDDPALADKILAKWPSHKDIRDLRLLQMYCEVRGGSITPSKCIELVNRILSLADSSAEKLQYSTVKAMMTAIVGESDEAEKLQAEALGSYLPAVANATKDGDLHACIVCAQALAFQGMLSGDLMAFERALGFLNKIALEDLTSQGASEVLCQKGLLLLHKGDIPDAIDCLTQAQNQNPGVLPLIYRMEAFVSADDLARAKIDLEVLGAMGIPENCKLEFYRSAASLSVKAGDAVAARKLVSELKAIELPLLYFRTQRDELCITLLEFIDQQQSQSGKTPAPSKIRGFLERIRVVSEYFELKPNLFGLGINMNRLLETKKKTSL
ncbi:MAG TPA: hypothetical protein VL486_13375 [Verrucomicrobiae bacterium]|nr:hypothetical protein [Verrucomicrobiae bacterium]